MALIPYELIYRNDLQAIGDFHSQLFCIITGDGNITKVQFKATDVTDFVDDWYFGLKVNGADVLMGADRPHITGADKQPFVDGLTIPVVYLDKISPTIDDRATGVINGPVTMIVFVDDGTSGGYSDEMAQDAVGAMLADTSTIDFTYTDATPELKADVKNDAITFAKMQNSSAASKLLGRGSASGAGDFEEITLGTNLSMSGTTLNAAGGGGGGGSGTFAIDDGSSTADGTFTFDDGDSA